MVARRRCSPPRRFTRDELLAIKKKGCVGIERRLRRFLFLLRLLRKCSFPHLSLSSIQHPIPVRITQRANPAKVSHFSPKPQRLYLRAVPRVDRHHTSVRGNKLLTYGLLNVRSLRGKVDAVIDLARDYSLDVVLLTESWHTLILTVSVTCCNWASTFLNVHVHGLQMNFHLVVVSSK